MADNVTISSAVRSNLLSLQQTTSLIDRTQGRLSTGLKVAGPIDDPVAYFQAKGLSDRASDFNEKKSGIGQGVSTLSSALEGIKGVESLVRQLKGIALNSKAATAEQIGTLITQFNDLRGQINNLTSDTTYQGLNLVNGTGSTLTVNFSNETSSVLTVASVDVTVDVNGLNVRKAVSANGGFQISYASNTGSTIANNTNFTVQYAGTGTTVTAGSYTVTYGTQNVTFTVGTAGATTTTFSTTETFTNGDSVTVRKVSDATLTDARAGVSLTANTFDVEFAANTNQGLSAGGTLSVTFNGTGSSFTAGTYTFGVGSATVTVTVGTTGATTTTFTNTEVFAFTEGAVTLTVGSAAANAGSGAGYVGVAAGAASQAASEAAYNNGGSYIDSSATKVRAAVVATSAAVTLDAMTGQYVLDSGAVAQINSLVNNLDSALATLRSRSQTLGSNVALLQTRLDFTKNYTNLLTEGSDKLTLADLNEEGANLLALQTRQQLGVQSLSFAGKAEQSILGLFR